jgi:hypothetical protein
LATAAPTWPDLDRDHLSDHRFVVLDRTQQDESPHSRRSTSPARLNVQRIAAWHQVE